MKNEKLITLLRGTRTVLQTLAEPIDWASRMLNNKHGYPPLRIRQLVGGLNDFEGSCGEYVAYLKLLCGLKEGDKLLDIGCGCGLITLDTTGAGSLLDYLGRTGIYVGFRLLLEAGRVHTPAENLAPGIELHMYFQTYLGFHYVTLVSLP